MRGTAGQPPAPRVAQAGVRRPGVSGSSPASRAGARGGTPPPRTLELAQAARVGLRSASARSPAPSRATVSSARGTPHASTGRGRSSPRELVYLHLHQPAVVVAVERAADADPRGRLVAAWTNGSCTGLLGMLMDALRVTQLRAGCDMHAGLTACRSTVPDAAPASRSGITVSRPARGVCRALRRTTTAPHVGRSAAVARAPRSAVGDCTSHAISYCRQAQRDVRPVQRPAHRSARTNSTSPRWPPRTPPPAAGAPPWLLRAFATAANPATRRAPGSHAPCRSAGCAPAASLGGHPRPEARRCVTGRGMPHAVM